MGMLFYNSCQPVLEFQQEASSIAPRNLMKYPCRQIANVRLKFFDLSHWYNSFPKSQNKTTLPIPIVAEISPEARKLLLAPQRATRRPSAPPFSLFPPVSLPPPRPIPSPRTKKSAPETRWPNLPLFMKHSPDGDSLFSDGFVACQGE